MAVAQLSIPPLKGKKNPAELVNELSLEQY